MTAAHVVVALLLQAVPAFALGPAASSAETLPTKIAALVPPGMKIVYQRITANPTLAVAEFSVEKSLPEGHTLTYTFEMNAYDSSSPLWPMRGPIYRQQVNENIAKETRGDPPAYTESDTPKETNYGWGSGVTRKLTHQTPQTRQYIDYQCVYFGMVNGVTFTLHVSGLQGSCDAANQWAASVAATAGKVSVSNIAVN
jgi:hypothetical protein